MSTPSSSASTSSSSSPSFSPALEPSHPVDTPEVSSLASGSALPKEVPQDLKVLRVAIRMLMDYNKVLTDGTRGYEIGCKCKDEFIAEALCKVITAAVGDLPSVVSSGMNIVTIKDVV